SRFPIEWDHFIKAHAHLGNNYALTPDSDTVSGKPKDYQYNEEAGRWEDQRGEIVNFELYARWRNVVLNNLMHDRSILVFFRKWKRTRDFPIAIIHQYLIKIRGMKQQAIDLIESI